MLVSELQEINNGGDMTAISNLKLWRTDAEFVSNIKLLTSYALLKNRVGHTKASSQIKQVIQCIKRARFFGEIDEGCELELKPLQPILTWERFESDLAAMTRTQQRVVLFCLGSGINLEDAQTLTWEEALRMKRQRRLNIISSDILKTSVRHFRADLVFWQNSKAGKAIPIFDMDHIVSSITNKSWDAYREQYHSLTRN